VYPDIGVHRRCRGTPPKSGGIPPHRGGPRYARDSQAVRPQLSAEQEGPQNSREVWPL